MKRSGLDGWKRNNRTAGEQEFYACIRDLAEHPVVQKMKNYTQHGHTSCYRHCMRVAYYNYRICRFLGLDACSAARAGMLHDLFLYDWHTHARKTGQRFHGLTHPRRALCNAGRHFVINDLEQEMILKHMWPLTVVPPCHPETLIICLVDKYCSLCETAGGWKKKLSRPGRWR